MLIPTMASRILPAVALHFTDANNKEQTTIRKENNNNGTSIFMEHEITNATSI